MDRSAISPSFWRLCITLRATRAVLIVTAAFAVATARAASVEVVTTSISPASATVGDRITLTIVIEHDNGIAIDAPRFGADFGGLEPTAVAAPSADQQGAHTRTTIGYTLVAFKPGDYTIPPMQIGWRATDGT